MPRSKPFCRTCATLAEKDKRIQPPLHILLPSDVFPPRTGGAGWSAHALARALQARGHTVQALVPQRGRRGVQQRDEAGVPVVEIGYTAPKIPFVANWARFERFWRQFAEAIVQAAPPRARQQGRLIIHGQHLQAIGAAVIAGRRLGVPVVGTVRDHWPWHYFATGLHGDQVPLARFGLAASATDLLARRGGLAGALSLLALPYVQQHVRRRQELLARCDAIISLSGYITKRLRTLLPQAQLHPIPNLVDLAEIDQMIAAPPQHQIEGPFMLFASKVARNKGAYLLPEVMSAAYAAGVRVPLVVAGGNDPALRAALAERGIDVHALDWADHQEILRLMARCSVLLFPSTWGEPLSRVLLEGCAVGAPIVALPTGGTPDLLQHNVNGLLVHSATALGQRAAQLLRDPELATRLGQAARRTAEQRLAAPIVAAQVEALYWSLLDRQADHS